MFVIVLMVGKESSVETVNIAISFFVVVLFTILHYTGNLMFLGFSWVIFHLCNLSDRAKNPKSKNKTSR